MKSDTDEGEGEARREPVSKSNGGHDTKSSWADEGERKCSKEVAEEAERQTDRRRSSSRSNWEKSTKTRRAQKQKIQTKSQGPKKQTARRRTPSVNDWMSEWVNEWMSERTVKQLMNEWHKRMSYWMEMQRPFCHLKTLNHTLSAGGGGSAVQKTLINSRHIKFNGRQGVALDLSID